MDNRRTWIWGGALAFVVLSSIGGAALFNGGVVGAATGDARGCNGGVAEVPQVRPGDVKVAPPITNDGPSVEIDPAGFIVPEQYLVRVKADTRIDDQVPADLREALQRIGASHMEWLEDAQNGRDLRLDEVLVLTIPGSRVEVVDALSGIDSVQWAEPSTECAAAGIVSDSYHGYQWNMAQLGVSSAWDHTRGRGVRIAVIDSGISDVPDGPANVLQDACLDLVEENGICKDSTGHGTAIGSLVAGESDDGVGVIGIAPDASILPIRALGPSGMGLTHAVARGIEWAIEQRADIVNLSCGMYFDSHLLRESVVYAEERGVSVVASAGNDGIERPTYPAAYPTVIGVGALDMAGDITNYSNRGADVYAPGGNVRVDEDGDDLPDGILVATQGNEGPAFYALEGTSMATAHVTGVVALLRGLGENRPNGIRERVMRARDGETVPELRGVEAVRDTANEERCLVSDICDETCATSVQLRDAIHACYTETCAPPRAGAACGLVYRPVRCDEGCGYANACLAESAGHDLATCEALPIKILE